MAATRLIPLHINKGKTVAQCLADRTDYAKNPEKTEKGELVIAYECDPLTVDEEFLLSKHEYEHATGRKQRYDVIAYQIRQSFKPGEITAEEANQIGYELAMRWTKGKHAFIVATHTDRAHIHNHIIYNSTSLDGTRKFRNFYLSSFALARMSDILCLEHQLSVIARKPFRERKKRTDYPRKPTQRDAICAAIDAALEKKPKDFDALICLLIEQGYEYKDGKHPALRGKEQKRFVRFRSLGDGYTVDELMAVLAGEKEHQRRKKAPAKSTQSHVTPQLQFQIDIQAKILEGKCGGYVTWAKVFNLKQAAEAMFFVGDHGISNLEELSLQAAAHAEKSDALLASIKADEERLQEIAVLKKHLINYAKSKDVFARYKASGYNREFFEAHRDVLTLRRAASKAFWEYEQQHPSPDGKKVKLPTVKQLSAEYAETLERKKKNYAEYHKGKAEVRDYLITQKILETMFGVERQQEEKKRQQEEPNR